MLSIIYIGLSSLIIQVIILRQLLSVFSGNELDIGITLSFWLIFVGIGSLLGKKISYKDAFPFTFLFISILFIPTIIGIKFIRHLLSIGFGEVISLSKNILFTAMLLFPICSIIGMQFPLVVSYVRERISAGRIYGLESAGAFAGGVIFTLFISSRIEVIYVSLIISLVNIAVLTIMTKNRWFIVLMIIPVLFFLINETYVKNKLWQNLDIVMKKESRYGEIDVVRFGRQLGVYMNNHLLFTYFDLFSEETLTHTIMTMHEEPKDVLCIGGSPGKIREILKYPVNHVDFVEIDPRLIEVSTTILYAEDTHILKDNRLRIINEDGRSFIKRIKDKKYDIVILDISTPSTASLNRFFTLDFFNDVKKVLKKGGIFSLWLQRSSGYIGKSMQIATGSIYNSLKSAFKCVELTSQEYGGYFSSETPIVTNPVVLVNRFLKRDIKTNYFQVSIFYDMFSDFGVRYVESRLKDVKSLNTDLKPSAYLYNLLLWAEIQDWNINYLLKFNLSKYFSYTGIILLLTIFYCLKKTKKIISYSVFTTGFSSMVFIVSLILLYQARYGYIYEMIGLLTATFMIGIWAGTNIKRKGLNPLKMLLIFDFCSVLISLSILFILKNEFFFYILIFICGLIAGAQFNFAWISAKDIISPGRLYAIDLFGSFLGSFLTTMIVLPLFGIFNAFLTISVIKIVSVFLISSILYFTESRMSVSQKEED